MTFRRVWSYSAFCDAPGCHRFADDQYPGPPGTDRRGRTPTQMAIDELRADGWMVVSRGDRSGFRTFCPDHRSEGRAMVARRRLGPS